MWKTVVPALTVLAAEAVIRRRINALPRETFPLRIGRRVQLRRAYNRGLLCADDGGVRLPPERRRAADRHGADARRRAGKPH